MGGGWGSGRAGRGAQNQPGRLLSRLAACGSPAVPIGIQPGGASPHFAAAAFCAQIPSQPGRRSGAAAGAPAGLARGAGSGPQMVLGAPPPANSRAHHRGQRAGPEAGGRDGRSRSGGAGFRASAPALPASGACFRREGEGWRRFGGSSGRLGLSRPAETPNQSRRALCWGEGG